MILSSPPSSMTLDSYEELDSSVSSSDPLASFAKKALNINKRTWNGYYCYDDNLFLIKCFQIKKYFDFRILPNECMPKCTKKRVYSRSVSLYFIGLNIDFRH